MIYLTLFSYELKLINNMFLGFFITKMNRKKPKLHVWIYRPKGGRYKNENLPSFKTSNMLIEFYVKRDICIKR